MNRIYTFTSLLNYAACTCITLALASNASIPALAQDIPVTPNRHQALQANNKKPTRAEILQMSVETLREMTLEELTDLASIVGVSSVEELFMLLVTTASKAEEKAEDAPGVMSVLTAREIKLFGAQTLKDAVNYITGATALTNFQNRNGIAIRGDQQGSPFSKHVLILIDGRPVRENLNGGSYSSVLAMFPLAGVERIELIRGPGSVLYGTGAYSGVVNVIMKKYAKPAFNLSVQGGSFETALATLDGGFTLGELRVAASAQALLQNNWQQTLRLENSSRDTTLAYRQSGVGANVGVEYRGITLNLSGMLYNNDTYGGGVRTPVVPVLETFWNADLGFAHLFTDWWKTSFNATASLYDNVPPDRRQGSVWRSRDAVVEITNYVKPAPNFNIVLGGLVNLRTGFWNQISSGTNVVAVEPYRTLWWSVYGQADYTLFEQLKLITGAQANSYDVERPVSIVPRLGAVWSISSDFTLKALYGQAFRAPIASETDAVFGVLSNPKLRPEYVTTFDAALMLRRESIQASLVYFNSIQRDLIIGGMPMMGRPPMYINANAYRSEGVEAEVRFVPLESWYILGSLSYQTNLLDDRVRNGSPVPNWIVRTGAGYTNADAGLSFGVMNIFNSATTLNPPPMTRIVNPPTDAYHLLSLNVRWDVMQAFSWDIGGAHIVLTARVENALDAGIWQVEWVRRNINTLLAAPGRAIYGGFSISW
jgi:outer membrane receptor for ferrienterochelin and colicins